MIYYFFQFGPHSLKFFFYFVKIIFSSQFNPSIKIFIVTSNLFFILIFTSIILIAIFFYFKSVYVIDYFPDFIN